MIDKIQMKNNKQCLNHKYYLKIKEKGLKDSFKGVSKMLTSWIVLLLSITLTFGDFIITDEKWTGANGQYVLFKRLTNVLTNETALISYHPGGRIEQLLLRPKRNASESEARLVSVLVGNNGNITAFLENKYYKSCPLIPWANRIANATYTFYGTSYDLPINEPSRNDALHGFLCQQNFTVTLERVSNFGVAVTLTKTFSNQLQNMYPGYPFQFTVNLTFELSAGGLSVFAKVVNLESKNAMPFYMGYHPYFNVQDVGRACIALDTRFGWVELLTQGDLQTGPLIPTGQSIVWTQWDGQHPIGTNASNNNLPNYYDNGYRIFSKAGHFNGYNGRFLPVENRVIDTVGNVTFVLWQDSKRMVFSQLFTGLQEKTGEKGIALEPQSGSTNAYNNGDHLTVLYPGQVFQSRFGFVVE
ncbi:aldose-1-epimerase [Reticulomyxa filosa]|uniref:Aldose-1-epimerase n=1 Tax=Reticulomyxa filosa TaxID=46433 RepID=X6M6Y6_RETFI|nr:aldose-1-epimerase [Reticulomyxa filosa]|eukprot:ETO09689.1 aldose-1-epimerase [Reticulomyxa filosa]